MKTRITAFFVVSTLAASIASGCGDDRNAFGPDDGAETFGEGGAPPEAPPGPSCASTKLATERRPLDLFIMLDKSGSMMGGPWSEAKSALKQFFENPPSSETSAALNYFPFGPKGSYSRENECARDAYSTFAVDLRALPDTTTGLAASLDANEPVGGTPLGLALEGALRVATARKAAEPDHQVAVVLVSDGEPTTCGAFERVDLETAARDARLFNGTLTFAVGMSAAPVAVLSLVAEAGGTGKPISVARASELGDALRRAQIVAVGCEIVVPKTAPDGRPIDPSLVNVAVRDASGTRRIPHAVGASLCGNKEGWFYDDPAAPSSIRLCPASCELLQQKIAPNVEVDFGCKTEVR